MSLNFEYTVTAHESGGLRVGYAVLAALNGVLLLCLVAVVAAHVTIYIWQPRRPPPPPGEGGPPLGSPALLPAAAGLYGLDAFPGMMLDGGMPGGATTVAVEVDGCGGMCGGCCGMGGAAVTFYNPHTGNIEQVNVGGGVGACCTPTGPTCCRPMSDATKAKWKARFAPLQPVHTAMGAVLAVAAAGQCATCSVEAAYAGRHAAVPWANVIASFVLSYVPLLVVMITVASRWDHSLRSLETFQFASYSRAAKVGLMLLMASVLVTLTATVFSEFVAVIVSTFVSVLYMVALVVSFLRCGLRVHRRMLTLQSAVDR